MTFPAPATLSVLIYLATALLQSSLRLECGFNQVTVKTAACTWKCSDAVGAHGQPALSPPDDSNSCCCLVLLALLLFSLHPQRLHHTSKGFKKKGASNSPRGIVFNSWTLLLRSPLKLLYWSPGPRHCLKADSGEHRGHGLEDGEGRGLQDPLVSSKFPSEIWFYPKHLFYIFYF